jgi:hypothetical protein
MLTLVDPDYSNSITVHANASYFGPIAAKRYEQGFHFVNCGADIVAVTAWMSTEMWKLKTLVRNMKVEMATD